MGLRDFVELAKEKGLSRNEITSELRKKGYSDNEIREAFGDKIIEKTKRVNSEIEPIEKIKMLFLNPSEFFQKVKDETIFKSLIFYVTISLIVLIISYMFAFVFKKIYSPYGISGYIGLLSYGMGIFYFIFCIIITFVYSGIVHLAAKIAGGEGRFVDSYNAITYSLIISSVLSIIPILGMLAIIYSIVLAVFGISEYHKMSKGKAVTAVLSPIILLAVIIILLMIIFLPKNFLI